MAIVLEQVMPEGVSLQMLDAVADEMGVDTDPPVGLIVHTHHEKNGRVHVTDVWESREAHNTFAEQRLMPAMMKVAERNGMTPPAEGPETSMQEVHRLVLGKR